MPSFSSRPPLSSHNRSRTYALPPVRTCTGDNLQSLDSDYSFNISSRPNLPKAWVGRGKDYGVSNSSIGESEVESETFEDGPSTRDSRAQQEGRQRRRRSSTSSLDNARVEATRNGIFMSGPQFARPDPKPILATSPWHPLNIPISKPPEGFFESLYEAIGVEPPTRFRNLIFKPRADREELKAETRAVADATRSRLLFSASQSSDNTPPDPVDKRPSTIGGVSFGKSVGGNNNSGLPLISSGRHQRSNSASASFSLPSAPTSSTTYYTSRLTDPAPSSTPAPVVVRAVGPPLTTLPSPRRHSAESNESSRFNFNLESNDITTKPKAPLRSILDRTRQPRQHRPPPTTSFWNSHSHLALPDFRVGHPGGSQESIGCSPPDTSSPHQVGILPLSTLPRQPEENMGPRIGFSRRKMDGDKPALSVANVRADMNENRNTNNTPMPPVRTRMTVHHPDQRTSMAFATHISSSNQGSPLRTVETANMMDVSPLERIGRIRSSTYGEQHAQQMQRPGTYDRPRRFSNASHVSTASNMTGSTSISQPDSFHSFESAVLPQDHHVRSSSWSSNSSYNSATGFQTHPSPNSGPVRPHSIVADNWQHLQLQQYHHRRIPDPIKQFYRPLERSPLNEQFARLPSEVLEMILDHLKSCHLAPGSNSCATCWMRDCCSLAQAGNRKLLKSAREALYSDIQLVGPEGPHQKKKYKYLLETRMVLLRRTLRANPVTLAALVRFLKVPAIPSDTAEAVAEDCRDLVASVVMTCPNLERLNGFYPAYNHGFSRFFLAMSTRKQLRDVTWIIDASPFVPRPLPPPLPRVSSWKSSKGRHAAAAMAAALAEEQAQGQAWGGELHLKQQGQDFLAQHALWKNLSHMTIHCLPGARLKSDTLLPATFAELPALKTLYLSHVPATALTNDTLLTLPALKKLTLAHCDGVSSSGLSAFSRCSASNDLESLTLIHSNFNSLPDLVRLFSNLRSMTTFNLVQDSAPTLPADTSIWLMPYLASSSLKKLHWDVIGGNTGANSADSILARSITANGFPALRVIRVPNDTEGLFQALCQPRERVDLPGDRYKGGLINHVLSPPTTTAGAGRYSMYFAGGAGGPHGGSTKIGARPIHSGDGNSAATLTTLGGLANGLPAEGAKGKVTNGVPVPSNTIRKEAGSDLHQARLAAQARLENARRYPRFGINVVDEYGTTLETYGIGGFIGNIQSRISYCLVPDPGAVDERGGLVGITELLSDGGENLYAKEATASASSKDSSSGGWVGAGYGTGWISSDENSTTKDSKSSGKDVERNKLSRNKSSNNVSKLGDKGGVIGEKEDANGNKKTREGCTGKWSAYSIDAVDKKDKDRWWHVERGRWRGVVLS